MFPFVSKRIRQKLAVHFGWSLVQWGLLGNCRCWEAGIYIYVMAGRDWTVESLCVPAALGSPMISSSRLSLPPGGSNGGSSRLPVSCPIEISSEHSPLHSGLGVLSGSAHCEGKSLLALLVSLSPALGYPLPAAMSSLCRCRRLAIQEECFAAFSVFIAGLFYHTCRSVYRSN